MIEVIVNGETFQCTKAVKGNDFIRLFDSNGMFASFEGITDFSGYRIVGGDWSIPGPTAEERLSALEEAMLMLI